jgi:PAS domain S-box-containing protein
MLPIFKKIIDFYRPASLRFRLTVPVLTIAVIILVSSTLYISNLATEVVAGKSVEQLKAANRTLSTAVSVWVDTHINILRNLVSLPDIVSMDPVRQKPILEKMAASYPYMYLVSTTDMNGINVARNDDEKPKDYGDRRWFRGARDGAPVTFQSLVSRTVNKPGLAVSMPIKNSSGKIIGVGMFSLNLENLTHQVRVTQVGKTGFAYLIDRQNRVIAHPELSQFDELTDLNTYPPVTQLRKGIRGDIGFADNSGVRWRAFLSELDNGWGIIVQQREEELLGTGRMLQRVFIISIITAVLILTAATWWVVRSALQPIEALTKTVTGISSDKLMDSDLNAIREATLGIRTNDEIGKLAAGFANLTSRLQTTLGSLSEELSERRQAEETVRTSNNLLKSVIRAATAYSIIGTDANGLIKLFNEGATLMLGYRSEDVIDKVTPLLFHDPDEVMERAAELGIEPGMEVFIKAARHGETETREWTYIRKDGSRIAVSLTVTAMYSEEGMLTGFIGVARDISNEKKMEQQLVQSQKMETVGLLAGGIAHDFNNLLTPVLGYTDLLMEDMQEGDRSREHMQQIAQAAMRAKELTQRLLVFSRKQMIELKPVNLGDIVCQFENMLRRTIRENIIIEVRVSEPLSMVMADAGQIEQVLVNLSVNAQDAMPEGGILTIEARDIELDQSNRTGNPDLAPGKYVLLTISDTGVGIDKKTIEHIFEPFYTTKELGKGTGLGLSTAYGIVKQHGGSISVYSEIDRGTIFKVFLSCAEIDGSDNEQQSVSQDDESIRGFETILVVEDNEMVRNIACQILAGLGYNVLEAEAPDRCIEMVSSYEGTIHLLLTDVIMPRMDGKALFDRLNEKLPGIRVLFMSGYASNVIGHHGVLDEGMNFIQKPFSLHALAQKVRQALDS